MSFRTTLGIGITTLVVGNLVCYHYTLDKLNNNAKEVGLSNALELAVELENYQDLLFFLDLGQKEAAKKYIKEHKNDSYIFDEPIPYESKFRSI